jgi:microcystin-dependent protein
MVFGGISFAIPGIIPEAAADEPFIGEVRFKAFNFANRGWTNCDGQLLSISSNTALFSLLGTIYGGDGRTTFGIPDMKGRFLMHPGNGPGLSSHNLGQRGGSETINLTLDNLPNHSHTISNANLTSSIFTSEYSNVVLSNGNAIGLSFARTFSNQIPNVEMNPSSILVSASTTSIGDGTSVDNMPPYLALNCQIATVGLYPSRN